MIEALQANDWAGLPDEQDEPGLEADSDSEFGLGEAGDLEGLRQAILGASMEREREGRKGDEKEGGEKTGGSTEGGEKASEGGGKTSQGQAGGEQGEEDISEDDVRKMEAMMGKLLAAREMGEGMPEAERRRMARRAVGEVMKEL